MKILFLLAVFLPVLQAQSANSSIEGTVVIAGTNTSVAAAHVTLMGAQGVQIEADQNGYFVFRGLQPGRYRILVTNPGYVPSQYGQRQAGGQGTYIDVGPSQQVRGVTVGLIPKGALSGRISDANGDPIQGADVQAFRYAYQDGRRILIKGDSASSDEQGNYVIPSLIPGPYVVSAAAKSGEARLPVYFPGTNDVSSASSIDLLPGMNFTGVDLRVMDSRPVHVRGRMTNGLTGQPAAGVAVTLVPRRGTVATGSTQRVTASAGGAFDFHDIAPGSYDIVASMSQNADLLGAGFPVDIGSADVDNINLVLQPQFTIAGKVTVENQTAPNINLSSLRVELRREPYTPELLVVLPTIAADGTFRLYGVTPGEYRLKVDGIPNTYVKFARFGTIDALNPPIHIDAGIGPLDIVLGLNAGTVDAVVVDDKLKAVLDATVVLVPEPPRRNRADLYESKGTDSTGRARLTGIAPGDYRVFAWDDIPSDAWFDPDYIRPYESRGKAVHISEGGVDTVQLDLIGRP